MVEYVSIAAAVAWMLTGTANGNSNARPEPRVERLDEKSLAAGVDSLQHQRRGSCCLLKSFCLVGDVRPVAGQSQVANFGV